MRIRNQSGFTIIEVLQASALSSVAVVGLSTLLFTTMHGNIHARDITTAANVAESKCEELRAIPFSSVTNGSDSITRDGATYARTWTVFNGPTSNTKEVLVSVSGMHQEPGPVNLRTLIGG